MNLPPPTKPSTSAPSQVRPAPPAVPTKVVGPAVKVAPPVPPRPSSAPKATQVSQPVSTQGAQTEEKPQHSIPLIGALGELLYSYAQTPQDYWFLLQILSTLGDCLGNEDKQMKTLLILQHIMDDEEVGGELDEDLEEGEDIDEAPVNPKSEVTEVDSEREAIGNLAREYADEILLNEEIMLEVENKIDEMIVTNRTVIRSEEIKIITTFLEQAIGQRTNILDLTLRNLFSKVLSKFLNRKLAETKEELLVEISNVLYDEMIFHKVVTKINQGYLDEIRDLEQKQQRLQGQRDEDVKKLQEERMNRLQKEIGDFAPERSRAKWENLDEEEKKAFNSSLSRGSFKEMMESDQPIPSAKAFGRQK